MPRICLKKRNCLKAFILFLIFVNTSSVSAQEKLPVDSVAEKINSYALQHPSATLFVHFDKNVYANNEHVWFTAYLLKNNTGVVHHTLGISLMRNDDRSILTEGKIRIENELAFGNLVLPDSLPAGNYTFICFTDHMVNGNPTALFQQPVTIKSSKAEGFSADLILRDSLLPGTDSVRVLLRAYRPDLTMIGNASVKYFIGERTDALLKWNMVTDRVGEAEIKIPLNKITSANNTLQAEVSDGRDMKTFSLKLPVYKKETIVKFYPEGGNLVTGAKNTVGWEVKNNEGEPLLIKGSLFEDDKIISSVYTDANGMGSFSLTPEQGRRYHVKLSGAADADSMYTLPAYITNAPVLSIKNAIASDTLLIEITNTNLAQPWTFLIHNYQKVHLDASINSSAKIVRAKIPLTDVPKGLHAITILDAQGRPWAERIFFAHYDRRENVDITTDASTYTPRQKVKLDVKIADQNHHPIKAFFSVACVQGNRLDQKKMTDIESYFYLRNELNSFPVYHKLMVNDAATKDYLETVLLIKGWRRYSWTDVAKASKQDTLLLGDSLIFSGSIVKNKKPLKRPEEVIATNVSNARIAALAAVTTDSTGNFIVPMEIIQKLSLQGVIKLTVFNEDKLEYKITLNDPYKEMGKKLSASIALENNRFFMSSQSSAASLLPPGEVAKQMATVVVTAKKDNSIYWTRGTNECGDWVCVNNVLNCVNHPPSNFGTKLPVLGAIYTINGRNTITYSGCTKMWEKLNPSFEATIDGLRSPKEFYVEDLTKVSGDQFLSTLYWKHAVLTDDKGEVSLEFYTGDITGRFRIIVQGITDDDVFYGDHFFEVQK